MTTRIRISGDFNIWTLTEPLSLAQLVKSDGPVIRTVQGPLTGTMLLSTQATASCTVLPAGGTTSPTGWIPGDVAMMAPHLYLPSATPLIAAHSIYPLTNDAAQSLPDQIRNAMTHGSTITVYFGSTGEGEGVTLNCATLAFAVVTEAASQ